MRHAYLAWALVVLGCSAPDDKARVDATALDRATFREVEPVLGRRCGTIDCHGSAYRNFRIYGYGGLRLSPNDKPDTPDASTPSESDATYDALVGLEPELTRNVALAKGAGATELTLVRKGRGTEQHEGGALIVPGDDADLCLLGWLSSAPNAAACARAAIANRDG